MPDAHILLLIQQSSLEALLYDALALAGYSVEILRDGPDVQAVLQQRDYRLLILETTENEKQTFAWIEAVPGYRVILLAFAPELSFLLRLIRMGVADCLLLPVTPQAVLTACQGALARQERIAAAASLPSSAADLPWAGTDSLQELETIGCSLIASLDLDTVFRNIVDAAVSITGAEEGSLLLLEEDGSQLFMRAAKNFQDSFVQMFRLPVEDTIAGDVIRRGKPVLLNQATPRKIITQYLVRSLMYVPLRLSGKVIGVLGVDNRHSQVAFNHEQLSLVSTLADYAAIAIENARLYQKTELERHRLDLILGQIEDAVIVTGPDYRLLLANRKARQLFNLESETLFGQLLEDVFQNEAVIDLFKGAHKEIPYHAEIALEEGYVLAAHLVQIPNLGFAVTMQDISYFKELDRVKTDFVNTVSHDLRSPLTAILGYVQLIGRVGEVNQQQQEFIDRIQVNVHTISELINSLLELGRIESGLDTYKETVQLTTIIQYAVDELRYMADDRHQLVVFEPAAEIPAVYGDPVRLRQVAENLLVNAILYTPDKGRITIHLASQGDQVILQVTDNGLGIPQPDQPYIFDKFYRASNIPENISGSGLGLAIVKSIVENHQGRVWVDSRPGVGSCFTVVLPIQG